MPLMPVVTLPDGTNVRSAGVQAELERVDQRLQTALPGARITSYSSTGSVAFVSKDGRTTFALVYPRPDPNAQFGENTKAEEAARNALSGAAVAGAPVHLTGFDALANHSGGGGGPGVLLEAVIGGFGALLVLGFVFASLLALVPMVMAFISIMTDVPAAAGIDTADNGVADRAVPDRADRLGCRERLLAVGRLALA
jgi:RND superfamily putative drug exporter